MNVSNNFKDNIKEWISIDNNIMNIEDEIEPLKVKKCGEYWLHCVWLWAAS